MPRRRGSRLLALQILYESDITGTPAGELLERHAGDPALEWAAHLVEGVSARQAELDGVISGYSTDWTMERMPVIDRNLLRIAAFELVHAPEIPTAVAIDEAVELAKTFSTADSSRFINGVLGRIAEKTGTGV